MNFEFLKNPFVSGIICATIIIILFFIDSKIVKKKKEKKEYIKIFTEEINTKTDGFVLNWEYLEACEIKVPEKLRWSKAKYINRHMTTAR